MKNYKKLLTLFICNILISSNLFAALPENISELVEDSAPAVVNITAKKEVSQRQSFGYGGIPDEMLERFGDNENTRTVRAQRDGGPRLQPATREFPASPFSCAGGHDSTARC